MRFKVLMQVAVLIMLTSSIGWGETPSNASSLSGIVQNTDGNPISADVTVYQMQVQDGLLVPHFVCSSMTDRNGRYACERLEPGAYVLTAALLQAPAIKTKTQEGSTQHEASTPKVKTPPPAYSGFRAQNGKPTSPVIAHYPESSELKPWDLIHIGPDDSQIANIYIDPSEMSTLRAQPALGHATGQVDIYLQGDGFVVPLNIQAGVDSTNGSYVWPGLTAGDYRVAENWVTGSKEHKAIRYVTLPPASIKTISMAGNEFVQVDGRISSAKNTGSMAKQIVLNGATFQDAAQHYTTTIRKDGSFTFRDVLPGTYRIAFPVAEGDEVTSVSDGGDTLTSNAIGVSESPADIDITDKPATGAISGRLQLDGGEPKPGIVIESLDSLTSVAISVNNDGTFMIRGLAAGRYRVLGWADISKVPYMDSNFLSHYADKGASVEVDGNAVTEGVNVPCNVTGL